MISETATYYLMQAAEEEKDAAIRAHGLFHSNHEAWAVLKEEVEELCECLDESPVSDAQRASSQGTAFFHEVKKDIDRLWDKVRRDKKIGNDDVKEIFYWAKSCAEEAVQVMAMVQKWGESVEQLSTTLEEDVQIGGAKFCKGTHMLSHCPACGEWIVMHDNYCKYCGQRLDWSEVE